MATQFPNQFTKLTLFSAAAAAAILFQNFAPIISLPSPQQLTSLGPTRDAVATLSSTTVGAEGLSLLGDFRFEKEFFAGPRFTANSLPMIHLTPFANFRPAELNAFDSSPRIEGVSFQNGLVDGSPLLDQRSE